MSSNLMETSPGGESTQYETIKTVTEPHSKSGGQLSDPSTKLADPTTSGSNAENSQGISPAAKIRYGQTLSEGGMGGQTDARVNQGEARTEGGFGGTEALEGDADAACMRCEQGYGGMWVRDGFHLC